MTHNLILKSTSTTTSTLSTSMSLDMLWLRLFLVVKSSLKRFVEGKSLRMCLCIIYLFSLRSWLLCPLNILLLWSDDIQTLSHRHFFNIPNLHSPYKHTTVRITINHESAEKREWRAKWTTEKMSQFIARHHRRFPHTTQKNQQWFTWQNPRCESLQSEENYWTTKRVGIENYKLFNV